MIVYKSADLAALAGVGVFMEMERMIAKAKDMIGQRFKAPSEVCDSGIIQVVGSEIREPDCRFKVRGSGGKAWWCAEVVDGKPRGSAFAVGSDELEAWKEAPSP